MFTPEFSQGLIQEAKVVSTPEQMRLHSVGSLGRSPTFLKTSVSPVFPHSQLEFHLHTRVINFTSFQEGTIENGGIFELLGFCSVFMYNSEKIISSTTTTSP
jgi:hypothetical protein